MGSVFSTPENAYLTPVTLSLMMNFPFLSFLFVPDLIAHKSLYPPPPAPPLFPELDQSLGNPCFALLGHRIILRLSTQQLYFAGFLLLPTQFHFCSFHPSHYFPPLFSAVCVLLFSNHIFSHFVSNMSLILRIFTDLVNGNIARGTTDPGY